MQSLNIKIPANFKEELRRRAVQDRVPDRIYVLKALQEKFGWPLESLPVGNNYRPQPLNNPWAAPQNAGEFDEEDF